MGRRLHNQQHTRIILRKGVPLRFFGAAIRDTTVLCASGRYTASADLYLG